MKITEVNIPEKYTEPLGLAPILMKKLGNTVLVAGKNGAGKTRLLNLIKEVTKKIPTEVQIFRIEEIIKNSENIIASSRKDIQTLEKDINSKTQIRIKTLEEQIDNHNKSIDSHKEQLAYIPLISVDGIADQNKIVEFVPKSTTLKDSYTLSKSDIDRLANEQDVSKISDTTFASIQFILTQWININAPGEILVKEEDKSIIVENYERLKRAIKLFLDSDLKRDVDGNALLFDKRLGDAKLSDGQKILLQFCVSIYKYEGKLDEMIVLMDEPENHLHPSALIEVLDKIVENIPNGQLWIATHSINVLAHFDSSNLWFMADGKVSYAGNIPEKVLEGLLGNNDEIERLSAFLCLPAQFASYKFSYECLFYPEVAFTGRQDPQTKQIHDIISARIENGDKLRILDFGMGKGRLLASIIEDEKENGREANSWLDYFGFDKYPTYQKECEDIFIGIYGTDIKRYFTKEDEALNMLNESSFDYIIICNVLHEIEPGEWLRLFNSTHSLMKLLKPNGHLMIVEDQFLAVGEKAHSKGFLVLDSLQLKKLFAAKEEQAINCIDYRNDGRLKAHIVPAALTQNVTSETRKAALESLREAAKEEIRRIRGDVTSYKNGKLHAFWVQQLANATLALEELG